MSLFEEVEDDLWADTSPTSKPENDLFGDSLFDDVVTTTRKEKQPDPVQDKNVAQQNSSTENGPPAIVSRTIKPSSTSISSNNTRKQSFSKKTSSKTPSSSSFQQQQSISRDIHQPKKSKLPCRGYQIDMMAEEFGACKCGWNKNDHRPERRNSFRQEEEEKEKETQTTAVAKEKRDNEVIVQKREKIPCKRFQVDITAHGFGICKCGFDKESHAQHRRNSFSLQNKEKEEEAAAAAAQEKAKADEEARLTLLQQQKEQQRQKFVKNERKSATQKKTEKVKQPLVTANIKSGSNTNETIIDIQNALKKFNNNTSQLPPAIEQAIKTILSYKIVVPGVEEKKKVSKPVASSFGTPSKPTPVKKRRNSSKKRACNNYMVDMTAAEFGTCKCGMSKADHGGRRKSWSINHVSSSSEDEEDNGVGF